MLGWFVTAATTPCLELIHHCHLSVSFYRSLYLELFLKKLWWNTLHMLIIEASLVAQVVKNLPAMQETWVGKIPWRRKWQPTPVFLPGESHRQRSLAGCSPRSPKQADMTEQLTARNYRRVFQNCHTIFLPASKGWELLLLQGLISTFISSGFLRFVLHCCACFYLSHSDICMMASHCVLNLHFLND